MIGSVSRFAPRNTTPDQPSIWTTIEFEVAENDTERLAAALAEILVQPGWYASFESATEQFIVFPGRIFHYQRGDEAARAEAASYGRLLGVPDSQLDWPD